MEYAGNAALNPALLLKAAAEECGCEMQAHIIRLELYTIEKDNMVPLQALICIRKVGQQKSMRKDIIADVTPHEARVALLEDGELAEIQVELRGNERLVGNIYNGRVANVIAGDAGSICRCRIG